ncbi:MAG: discoidin domain-containing protein [Oscillospiraceae bacterium]|nr:discoidin domain-containing protein [Oscillospiraceae bacterium]
MKTEKRLLSFSLFLIMVVSLVTASILSISAASPVGTNLARLAGSVYSADYSESGREPRYAFDGDRTNSRWAGGDSHSNNWLRVDLPEVEPVSYVTIYFEALTKGANANQLNGLVVIECSGDGVEWQEVARQNYSNFTPKNVTLSFQALYTSRIRVRFPETQFWLSIYEFEVYYDGSAPSGDPAQLRNTVRQYQEQYTDSYISRFKMSSRDVYKAALENALAVLRNPSASQSEIDAARTALVASVSTSGSGNFRSANQIIFTGALKATALENWNELLYNLDNPDQDDWRAGDGLRSIPLTGVTGIGSGDEKTPSLLLFSDSYVSSYVDLSKSLHLNWLQMPNHVFANFSGIEPDRSKLSFVFGEKGDKSKLREPPTPDSEGGTSNVIPEGFWIQDAIVIDNTLFILFDHQNTSLVTINTSMAKVPILEDYKVDWENYVWLGYSDLWNRNNTFGVDIFDNTIEGGVPEGKADEYVYIYANVTSGSRRCGVARVKKADFEDTEKWEFYTTGGVWSAGKANIGSAAIITPSNFMISAQHSVTYINSGIYEGKYLMTYTEGGISERIGYLLGDNPWGPFTNPTICYIAPEVEQFTNELYQFDNSRAWYVTYTAVAHPQLSKPGELIISYDCYVWDSNKSYNLGWHGTETNEHYRERFFKLDLNQMGSIEPQDAYTLVSAGKPVTASSGANASNAVDTDDHTKWESTGNEPNKWLTVDLGKPTEVGRYILKHGGTAIVHNFDLEARNYLNTRRFKIQYSNDNANWTTVVDKQYNAYWQNDENFEPSIGRYWRLYIEQPTQATMDKATIHEFQLFGIARQISVQAPDKITVALDGNTAFYGDTINFTVNKGNTSLNVDAITLRSESGALLQSLSPNYNGVYSFTMPDRNVVIRVSTAESGIIDGKVEDEPDGVLDLIFTVESDLIHVSVTTLAEVRKLALYTNDKKISLHRQNITDMGDTLKWDLWFKMYDPGEFIIDVRGGIKAFNESDLKFKVTMIGSEGGLVPLVSSIK